ncbi:MAG: (2Fe-2S)-binding protein [Bryobacteraceae bacterium]
MDILVNGVSHTLDIDPNKPLLWVLREDLGLLGTKFGCGAGLCGCCTVLLDGLAIRSCVRPVRLVDNREVTTIEGLTDPLGKALKEAWLQEHVAQCGYCQPGHIVAAHSLLRREPHPNQEQIESGIQNLCRCGTYQRIRLAIVRAAEIASPAGIDRTKGNAE